MSNEHLLAVVFTILALFSLSTGMGIIWGACQYISYLEKTGKEELRRKRGSPYLVFAYFSTEDACLVGSVTLFEPPQIGQLLLLGSGKEWLTCTGQVSKIATITEPNPEEKVLWVELNGPQIYNFLVGQPGWEQENKRLPR